MKRSEMIDFIEDRLKYIKYSRTIQNPPSFKEVATELLGYIEKAGMLPPAKSASVKFCKWEPEDEN